MRLERRAETHTFGHSADLVAWERAAPLFVTLGLHTEELRRRGRRLLVLYGNDHCSARAQDALPGVVDLEGAGVEADIAQLADHLLAEKGEDRYPSALTGSWCIMGGPLKFICP